MVRHWNRNLWYQAKHVSTLPNHSASVIQLPTRETQRSAVLLIIVLFQNDVQLFIITAISDIAEHRYFIYVSHSNHSMLARPLRWTSLTPICATGMRGGNGSPAQALSPSLSSLEVFAQRGDFTSTDAILLLLLVLYLLLIYCYAYLYYRVLYIFSTVIDITLNFDNNTTFIISYNYLHCRCCYISYRYSTLCLCYSQSRYYEMHLLALARHHMASPFVYFDHHKKNLWYLWWKFPRFFCILQSPG